MKIEKKIRLEEEHVRRIKVLGREGGNLSDSDVIRDGINALWDRRAERRSAHKPAANGPAEHDAAA